MELRKYLLLLRRWWWLIVISSVVLGAGAYIATPAPTPQYAATTIVLVSQGSGGLPDVDTVNRGQRLASTYGELMHARPVLAQVITNLQINTTPEQLAGQVRVENVAGTNLLELTVQDSDPQQAAALANEIVRVFIIQNQDVQSSRYEVSRQNLQLEIDESSLTIEGVRTQRDLLDSEIKRLQRSIDVLNARELASASGLTSVQVAEREGLETEIDNKIVELNQIETQLNREDTRYQTLLQSYEEVRLLETQTSDFMTVVEEALNSRVVSSGATKLASAIQGLLGGMVLGVAGALLIEQLRVSVRTSEEVERLTGLSTLGVIGEIGGAAPADRLIVRRQSRSSIAEAYRVLRTNLDVLAQQSKLHTLIVTSASPREGKTTTAANLGAIVAQFGKEVILVDADLRRPSMHKIFQKSNARGLTTALTQENSRDINDHIHYTDVDGLRLMSSGPLPPNPADLLGSQRMVRLIEELTREAELVIFDSPPLLAMADATLLARQCDGTLLVVLAGGTRGDALKRTAEQSAQAGISLIGTVLNRVAVSRDGYYYYNYYYGSHDK